MLVRTQLYITVFEKECQDDIALWIAQVLLLGALGMFLPLLTDILPWLTALAAMGLAIIQVLAIFIVHVPKKEYNVLPINAVLLVLSLFAAWRCWGFFGA